MGKELKILLIGLGSIGKRHLEILKTLPGIQLAALRTNKGQLTVDSAIKEFYNLEDALAYQADGVILSNPTSLHVQSALPFLEAGIKVLIEKPIADTLEESQKLAPFKHLICVAYCMRFHPIMQCLHSKFRNDPPFKVSFKRSFYLPKWHPYADYRTEYTALKELGGGVIRTLSHEIDLAVHWFGKPQSVNGVVDKVSHLEMNTDDYAFFSLKTASGSRVNFELDFFSPSNINVGEAFTQQGKYTWDMHTLSFQAYTDTQPQIIKTASDAVDTMYQHQLTDFIAWLQGKNTIQAKYQESIYVLKIINEIENESRFFNNSKA